MSSEETLKAGVLNEIEIPDYRGRTVVPGNQVRLRAGHPHAGKVGVYKGVEKLAGGLWGALVRFADDDGGCYVFKAHFLELTG